MQPDKRAKSDSLQKVNLQRDDNLKSLQVAFMKHVETKNLERAAKWKKIRRNNNILASCLAMSVLGIYFYTISAVKQETFLDDFNEPPKIIEKYVTTDIN